MLIESIIPLDKVKNEAVSEGILSPAGLVLTRYNKVKECPSIATIQDLFKHYTEWENLNCTCLICGATIPMHFTRIMFQVGATSEKRIMHACIRHENSDTLRYVLKTLKQGGLIV